MHQGGYSSLIICSHIVPEKCILPCGPTEINGWSRKGRTMKPRIISGYRHGANHMTTRQWLRVSFLHHCANTNGRKELGGERGRSSRYAESIGTQVQYWKAAIFRRDRLDTRLAVNVTMNQIKIISNQLVSTSSSNTSSCSPYS
jgi:hypothetical protein